MAGEAATVTDNPYGIEALWTQSDYVGKGVFVILIVMSLWSWLVMINKWLDQRMLRKVAAEAEKGFWSAGSIQEGTQTLPYSAFYLGASRCAPTHVFYVSCSVARWPAGHHWPGR